MRQPDRHESKRIRNRGAFEFREHHTCADVAQTRFQEWPDRESLDCHYDLHCDGEPLVPRRMTRTSSWTSDVHLADVLSDYDTILRQWIWCGP